MRKTHLEPLLRIVETQVERVEPLMQFLFGAGLPEMLAQGLLQHVLWGLAVAVECRKGHNGGRLRPVRNLMTQPAVHTMKHDPLQG